MKVPSLDACLSKFTTFAIENGMSLDWSSFPVSTATNILIVTSFYGSNIGKGFMVGTVYTILDAAQSMLLSEVFPWPLWGIFLMCSLAPLKVLFSLVGGLVR
jgi:hypothetical protein